MDLHSFSYLLKILIFYPNHTSLTLCLIQVSWVGLYWVCFLNWFCQLLSWIVDRNIVVRILKDSRFYLYNSIQIFYLNRTYPGDSHILFDLIRSNETIHQFGPIHFTWSYYTQKNLKKKKKFTSLVLTPHRKKSQKKK